MDRDARKMRGVGPFVFAQIKHGQGITDISEHIPHAWQQARGETHSHEAGRGCGILMFFGPQPCDGANRVGRKTLRDFR